MIIVQSLCWKLKDHTPAPEVMAYRPLRRAVEHLHKGMVC